LGEKQNQSITLTVIDRNWRGLKKEGREEKQSFSETIGRHEERAYIENQTKRLWKKLRKSRGKVPSQKVGAISEGREGGL